MSLKIVETYWSWYNTTLSATEIRCLIECDTLLDLPGINSITGYKLTIGTVAHVIDTNSLYMMQSGGAWSVQAAGTDVYTRSQIDTMLAAKQDLLTFDPVPAANSDNPVKSKGIKSYVDAAVAGKATVSDIYGLGTMLSDVDLNTILTPGLYTCPSVTAAATIINVPITGSAFRLEVKLINNVNRVRQEFYPVSDIAACYVRSYTAASGGGSSWKPWYLITGTPV